VRTPLIAGNWKMNKTASEAAAIAKMMNWSILRWSLGGTQSSALNRPADVSPRGTMPAILAGMSDTSKAWMERMPDWPAIRRSQHGLTPHPNGVTRPMPVTTTRLMA